jgi:ubiquinone/menaquinone biosynthesis C-methylase UbiE
MSGESRFDLEAARWDDNPRRVALARSVGEAIIRATGPQPDWRAMDYGAGTGLVTLCLQPRLASVTAVDLSAEMLKQLAQKIAAAALPNVRILQWDLEKAPCELADLDLIFSSMTLHHLHDVERVFRQFFAMLKSGGRVAVADLDTEDGSFHGSNADVHHLGFDRRQIAQWLAGAGFADISVVNAHELERPDASGTIRRYGIFLASARKP